jgi:hypothetical protein
MHTPYTLHHTPYTLHHTPYTVHHTPYTLHHAPYTLHHAPCTIHHGLCTVHHTPIHSHTIHTVHHAPYTIHPTPTHHTPMHHTPRFSCTIFYTHHFMLVDSHRPAVGRRWADSVGWQARETTIRLHYASGQRLFPRPHGVAPGTVLYTVHTSPAPPTSPPPPPSLTRLIRSLPASAGRL